MNYKTTILRVKGIMIFLIVFAGILILASCESIGYTKINQIEYEQLVTWAREFAITNERELNASDKVIIMNSDPVFSVYYTGGKDGQYGFEWRLANGRALIVDGNGYMTEKKSLIKTQIIRTTVRGVGEQ